MADALAGWLHKALGVTLTGRSPVGGGCIHRAWRLELACGAVLFAKTNTAAALPLLEAEADGLRALAAAAPPALVVPSPLACELAGDQAVLVLPWLDLAGGSLAGWSALGRGLAGLHRASLERAGLDHGPGQDRYGWSLNNFIGSTHQPNAWCANWAQFFSVERLGHQLKLARSSSQALGGTQALRGSEALLERSLVVLAKHRPEAVLVHGDLWSGNAALLASGCGALLDPAVYRGDREVDLAMARLFGGFPEAFFNAYELAWPLPAGSKQRVQLYNLYHLLNHANLFGGGYWSQAQKAIDALLAQG